MLALLASIAVSACTPQPYLVFVDGEIVTEMRVKQYACDLERGEHRYSAAGDKQLQRRRADFNHMEAWERAHRSN